MPRFEKAPEGFKLQDGWLCLTKNGWLPELEEVAVQLGVGLTLETAMDMVWGQHQGLLGEGELFFTQTGESGGGGIREAMPSGFITFRPSQTD